MLSFILSGLSFWFANHALNTTLETQQELKGIDLLVYFQKRYDDLIYDGKKKVNDKNTATDYYHRFWDLQFEQYQY